AAEKIQSPLPFLGRRADQRRLVLLPRIEQESRSRLDHAAELQPFEQRADALRLTEPIRRERIERGVVQGDRDTLITQVGENEQGIVEAVMGEPVGVVAEEHAGEASKQTVYWAPQAHRQRPALSVVHLLIERNAQRIEDGGGQVVGTDRRF